MPEFLPLSIADISIWTAILAGALSFLSPCVLPLVPPYLCYMAGVSVDQFRSGEAVSARSTRRAVLPAALLFTLGFATVFVSLVPAHPQSACSCASTWISCRASAAW